MTSTDRVPVGVIGALSVFIARLYEIKAAFGVVIVCVAFATTIEVMMTTTVAIKMTAGRENFWIRIVIAFILFGFLLSWFSLGRLELPVLGSHFWPFSHVLQEIREKVKPKSRNPRIADSSSRKSGQLLIRTHNEALSVGNDSVHGNRSKILTRRTPASG